MKHLSQKQISLEVCIVRILFKFDFLHQMKHEIHDLNQMVSSSYLYLVPKMHTFVLFEEFVEQNN